MTESSEINKYHNRDIIDRLETLELKWENLVDAQMYLDIIDKYDEIMDSLSHYLKKDENDTVTSIITFTQMPIIPDSSGDSDDIIKKEYLDNTLEDYVKNNVTQSLSNNFTFSGTVLFTKTSSLQDNEPARYSHILNLEESKFTKTGTTAQTVTPSVTFKNNITFEKSPIIPSITNAKFTGNIPIYTDSSETESNLLTEASWESKRYSLNEFPHIEYTDTLPDPENNNDLAHKGYVDAQIEEHELPDEVARQDQNNTFTELNEFSGYVNIRNKLTIVSSETIPGELRQAGTYSTSGGYQFTDPVLTNHNNIGHAGYINKYYYDQHTLRKDLQAEQTVSGVVNFDSLKVKLNDSYYSVIGDAVSKGDNQLQTVQGYFKSLTGLMDKNNEIYPLSSNILLKYNETQQNVTSAINFTGGLYVNGEEVEGLTQEQAALLDKLEDMISTEHRFLFENNCIANTSAARHLYSSNSTNYAFSDSNPSSYSTGISASVLGGLYRLDNSTNKNFELLGVLQEVKNSTTDYIDTTHLMTYSSVDSNVPPMTNHNVGMWISGVECVGSWNNTTKKLRSLETTLGYVNPQQYGSTPDTALSIQPIFSKVSCSSSDTVYEAGLLYGTGSQWDDDEIVNNTFIEKTAMYTSASTEHPQKSLSHSDFDAIFGLFLWSEDNTDSPARNISYQAYSVSQKETNISLPPESKNIQKFYINSNEGRINWLSSSLTNSEIENELNLTGYHSSNYYDFDHGLNGTSSGTNKSVLNIYKSINDFQINIHERSDHSAWYPMLLKGYESLITFNHNDSDSNTFTTSISDKIGYHKATDSALTEKYSRYLLHSLYSEKHSCDGVNKIILQDEIKLGHYCSNLSTPKIKSFDLLYNSFDTTNTSVGLNLARNSFNGYLINYQSSSNTPSYSTIKWNGYPYATYLQNTSNMYAMLFNNEFIENAEISSITTLCNYNSLVAYGTRIQYDLSQKQFKFSMLPDPGNNNTPIFSGHVYALNSTTSGKESTLSLNATKVIIPNIKQSISGLDDIDIASGKIVKDLNNSITTLDTTVTTLDTTVTTLDTTVTTLDTTVTEHASSITTLNTTVTEHSASIEDINEILEDVDADAIATLKKLLPTQTHTTSDNFTEIVNSGTEISNINSLSDYPYSTLSKWTIASVRRTIYPYDDIERPVYLTFNKNSDNTSPLYGYLVNDSVTDSFIDNLMFFDNIWVGKFVNNKTPNLNPKNGYALWITTQNINGNLKPYQIKTQANIEISTMVANSQGYSSSVSPSEFTPAKFVCKAPATFSTYSGPFTVADTSSTVGEKFIVSKNYTEVYNIAVLKNTAQDTTDTDLPNKAATHKFVTDHISVLRNEIQELKNKVDALS